jgi:hypothetical protein
MNSRCKKANFVNQNIVLREDIEHMVRQLRVTATWWRTFFHQLTAIPITMKLCNMLLLMSPDNPFLTKRICYAWWTGWIVYSFSTSDRPHTVNQTHNYGIYGMWLVLPLPLWSIKSSLLKRVFHHRPVVPELDVKIIAYKAQHVQLYSKDFCQLGDGFPPAAEGRTLKRTPFQMYLFACAFDPSWESQSRSFMDKELKLWRHSWRQRLIIRSDNTHHWSKFQIYLLSSKCCNCDKWKLGMWV